MSQRRHALPVQVGAVGGRSLPRAFAGRSVSAGPQTSGTSVSVGNATYGSRSHEGSGFRTQGRYATRTGREGYGATEDLEGLATLLYESVVDVRVPMSDLVEIWGRVLASRSMVPAASAETIPAAQWTAGTISEGGSQKRAASSTLGENWKGRLQQLYGRAKGRGTLVYGVEEDGGGFRAVVEAEDLGPCLGDVQSSKKLAEHSAARKAVEAHFAEAETQGPKQTDAGSKSRLHQMLTLLLGRQACKEDAVYEVVPDNEGLGHMASVRLSCYDEPFQGVRAPTRKLAEAAAADSAIAAIAEDVEPLEREHLAKKRKLKQVKRAAANAAPSGVEDVVHLPSDPGSYSEY
mmetsp:Transcript_30729/g.69077  ORF Transcript_30729/g.69077 Transcript_30729/m.69077 type:complete len:348 (+) Transcript_30729:40-1083(+)